MTSRRLKVFALDLAFGIAVGLAWFGLLSLAFRVLGVDLGDRP